MFTRPGDLTDADVTRALGDGWGLVPDQVAYAPVGFGSHHWRVTAGGGGWFATVDDLDARRRNGAEQRQDVRRRLRAALTAACRLREGGLDFVVAPIRSQRGDVLQGIGDRYEMALYPHVEGETSEFGSYPARPERLAVLDRIVAVHAATELAVDVAGVDDFAIPSRDPLELALSQPVSWGPGPHAEDARRLVDRHADSLRSVLRRYDDLVSRAESRKGLRVLTHGEPHRANTITTAEGKVLIDWDTALLAPPERDLWALIDEDSTVIEHYSERAGTEVDLDTVTLYRLAWDLTEIALFVDEFRKPHRDTEDVRVAWSSLVRHLDPRRWAEA